MEQPTRGGIKPVYFLSLFGLLGLASIGFPVLNKIVGFIPEIGNTTTAMAVIICVMAYAFTYMYRQSFWEGELRRSVRGAQGQSIRTWAALALAWALGLAFIGTTGVLSALRGQLPEMLGKLTVPPLQVSVFGGITLFFGIMAALDHMAKMERAGFYQRPLYLRPEVDLPELAIELLKENLRIPEGEPWKIIERAKTPSGGIQFVLFWTEKVKRLKPDGESVQFTQEKRYAVELDVRGNIVSVKERA